MKGIAFILRRVSTILSVAVLTLTLVAAVTGILLAFYYEPTAGGAYNSLQSLSAEVSNGWLIRSIHDIAGNWVIVVALIQLVVMFLGERFRRSWLTAWISGILFILAAIGLGWTAMILDWSQMGFWRLRIELGTIEAIPFIGAQLRQILTGGAIGSVTVAHMYTLHSYVLSVGAIILSIVHLVGLLQQEREVVKEVDQSLTEETVSQAAQSG
jgi:cytochrome b6